METLFKWICLEFLSSSSSENFLPIAFIMPQTMINDTNITECLVIGDESMKSYSVLETTLIATVTTLLSLVTIIGNVLVMVAFNMDRRLQTVNNYFLLSLAVADFMIGLISMPLFTSYILTQGWTLGPIVCDLWLALDYLCSNASVLNLLMISLDRYRSVKDPLGYLAERSGALAAKMIAFAWMVSFLIWPPWILAWPYIDGKRSVPEDRCYIQFLQTNSFITFLTALIAFYLPVIFMSLLYYKIWRMTEERKKNFPAMNASLESQESNVVNSPNGNCTQRLKEFLIALCNVCCDDEVEDESLSPGGNTPSSAETPIQSSRTTSVTLRPDQIAYLDSVISQEKESAPDSIYTVLIRFPEQNTSEPELRPSVTMIPGELPRLLPAPMKSSLSTSALMAHSVTNPALTRCSSSEALSAVRLATGRPSRLPRPNLKKKELRTTEKKGTDTKAARTLSAILLAFIITWTPYNVLVLVKSVETWLTCEDLIPQVLWDFSYYLCYINSMVNPICYALANANFRKTYWRILTCTWRKQSKLSIIRGMHSKAS